MDEKPAYADFEPAMKFAAIQSIIAKRLLEHPKAFCSYSGGSDSDILLDLIERTRKCFELPPITYVFFDTGLEMEATKRHVKETAEKYGVEIQTVRPKKSIVTAVREKGIPFLSKMLSFSFEDVQKKSVPLSVTEEYNRAEDKPVKYEELKIRYPKATRALTLLCSCDRKGNPLLKSYPNTLNKEQYFYDFLKENPIPFKISAQCCDICKKQPAHTFGKNFEMSITGERFAEGGARSISFGNKEKMSCFSETVHGFRLKPLFYVNDKDKAWYKETYGIRYSDAYEVYGMKRTGCCGCPISCNAVKDLEIIGKYEPNIQKAAWNVFGDSYRYRQAYNEYKAKRRAEEKAKS